MLDVSQEPFWAAPALLAAVIAALAFVGKTATELLLRLRDEARERKSRLVDLYALLRAGDVAFAVQRELSLRLADLVRQRLPDLAARHSPGFDRLFTAAYAVMNHDELQLHRLIRNITIHTFRPLNQSLLEWLRADRHFRAASPSHPRLGRQAMMLAQLEAHLILWVAKYEAWIPDQDEHALVYLADEERHRIGFPKGGSNLVAEVLGHPHTVPPGVPPQ